VSESTSLSADVHAATAPRTIGLWGAIAIGVGGMIGAGIFSLLGVAAEVGGQQIYLASSDGRIYRINFLGKRIIR